MRGEWAHRSTGFCAGIGGLGRRIICCLADLCAAWSVHSSISSLCGLRTHLRNGHPRQSSTNGRREQTSRILKSSLLCKHSTLAELFPWWPNILFVLNCDIGQYSESSMAMPQHSVYEPHSPYHHGSPFPTYHSLGQHSPLHLSTNVGAVSAPSTGASSTDSGLCTPHTPPSTSPSSGSSGSSNIVSKNKSSSAKVNGGSLVGLASSLLDMTPPSPGTDNGHASVVSSNSTVPYTPAASTGPYDAALYSPYGSSSVGSVSCNLTVASSPASIYSSPLTPVHYPSSRFYGTYGSGDNSPASPYDSMTSPNPTHLQNTSYSGNGDFSYGLPYPAYHQQSQQYASPSLHSHTPTHHHHPYAGGYNHFSHANGNSRASNYSKFLLVTKRDVGRSLWIAWQDVDPGRTDLVLPGCIVVSSHSSVCFAVM